MHVKKGDSVIVIAGNDKGKVGEITAVRVDRREPERARVIVAGVNLRWKHKRATQNRPKGERVQEECSIHHSNVMLYDPETKKGTRKRKSEAKR
jgi:large subunit ribosomal protein L24